MVLLHCRSLRLLRCPWTCQRSSHGPLQRPPAPLCTSLDLSAAARLDLSPRPRRRFMQQFEKKAVSGSHQSDSTRVLRIPGRALTHTEHTLWSVCKEEGGPGVASDGSRRNLNSLSDPWETLGTLHTKLAREGMIRLCIEIQLDTDSEKLWAVQSGRFEARSLALSLARSLSSRSRSPSQHSPSSSSRDHSPAQ